MMHKIPALAGARVEVAWGGAGGEPEIPAWLRYGEADVHDALSSNSKLRPDQVRALPLILAIKFYVRVSTLRCYHWCDQLRDSC